MTDDMLTQKATLTLAGAKTVAAAAEAEAAKNRWPVVIVVVDDGGHLLVVHRLDQAQLGSIDVAIGKARSAVLFKRDTKQWEETFKAGRLAPLAFPNLMPAEGGVPIMVGGQIVGGIGVSGVKADQDAQVARAGAAVVA